eukprot:Pgem_evm1s7922
MIMVTGVNAILSCLPISIGVTNKEFIKDVDVINFLADKAYSPLHLAILGLIIKYCNQTNLDKNSGKLIGCMYLQSNDKSSDLRNYRQIINTFLTFGDKLRLTNSVQGSSVLDYIQTKTDFPKDLKTKIMALKDAQLKVCNNKCSSSHVDDADLKSCGRCCLVKYCKPSCQKEDWPAHKVYCKKSVKNGGLPESSLSHTGEP